MTCMILGNMEIGTLEEPTKGEPEVVKNHDQDHQFPVSKCIPKIQKQNGKNKLEHMAM